MMKKILFILPLIVLAVFAGLYFVNKKTPIDPVSVIPEENVLGTSQTPSTTWDFVSTPFVSGDKVTLIANYKESKTSDVIQKENSCTYLVNAGFYTKENTPVGLFISEEKTLRQDHQSDLFDGFLTINEMLTPRITRNLPADNLKYALQTGPILFENAKVAKLSIKNDKLARRVAAVINGENEIAFVMVQSSELEKLPEALTQWSGENNITIADAINLDGGSASTFRGPNVTFPEISPIGSAFCIK